MEISISKTVIGVIRAEQQRRASRLADEDSNFAYDQWLFTDEPFVNELCHMFLVALSHQVQRGQVSLAARAGHDGKEITREHFRKEVDGLRRGRGGRDWNWNKIHARLNDDKCKAYKSMDVLRLLANSYKHDFSMRPAEKLLKSLGLETSVNYASLPESDCLRKALAGVVSLGKDATYCDIADGFVDMASGFLAEIQSKTKLSPVRPGRVSTRDLAR